MKIHFCGTVFLISLSFARPIVNKITLPQITFGRYEAKVNGDVDTFTLLWNLNSDSSFTLRMTPDHGKGQTAYAKGKWYISETAFQLYEADYETERGWQPFRMDSIPIQEYNDTLLRVMILHNEATFRRKMKK